MATDTNCAAHRSTSRVRYLTVTGVLTAVASVLMLLEFPVPLMPAFIKMDFSEIPALLAAFALGPVSGVTVCLLKNLLHLPFSATSGVGELCNFLMGVTFVLPAGLCYKLRHTRRAALLSMLTGAVLMAGLSLPLNYLVTYPIYSNFMPLDAIIGAYADILPGMNNLFFCLLVFNLPFTLVKGALDTAVTFLIYKPLSPFLKGKRGQNDRRQP